MPSLLLAWWDLLTKSFLVSIKQSLSFLSFAIRCILIIIITAAVQSIASQYEWETKSGKKWKQYSCSFWFLLKSYSSITYNAISYLLWFMQHILIYVRSCLEGRYHCYNCCFPCSLRSLWINIHDLFHWQIVHRYENFKRTISSFEQATPVTKFFHKIFEHVLQFRNTLLYRLWCKLTMTTSMNFNK